MRVQVGSDLIRIYVEIWPIFRAYEHALGPDLIDPTTGVRARFYGGSMVMLLSYFLCV